MGIVSFFFAPKKIESSSHKQVFGPQMGKVMRHRILFVHTEPGLGGAQVTMIAQVKAMLQEGCLATLLIPRGSGIERLAQNHGLSYYSTCIDRLKTCRPLYKLVLWYQINYLAHREKISIVHADTRHVVFAAKRSSRALKVVFIHQDTSEPRLDVLRVVDGVICVSPTLVELVSKQVSKLQGCLPAIEYLPPFFEQEKFVFFKHKYSKEAYFKGLVGHAIDPSLPVLVMVGHMYMDWEHKNHRLLLQSLDLVINKMGKKVHVFFAGDGPRRQELEAMSKGFDLQDYAYFLGEYQDVAQLLYHADFEVLASSNEAFGIVLAEGALMKKPLIAAANTGAENIVKHHKTGLLFTKGDKESLANAIMCYIDHPDFRKKMGDAAFDFVREKFNQRRQVRQAITFYEGLLDQIKLQQSV